MPMPTAKDGKLALPVIASPLPIVSGPDLVIEQCKAGKGKQGPKRWLDVWGAGHSVSGVTGIPSVAELVAATAREYEGARLETAKLF